MLIIVIKYNILTRNRFLVQRIARKQIPREDCSFVNTIYPLDTKYLSSINDFLASVLLGNFTFLFYLYFSMIITGLRRSNITTKGYKTKFPG